MVGRKKGSPTLTPLELQIMQVLWQTGPSNVQTVQEKLAGDKLAYTTIQTMLNVLHRKCKVKRTLEGRAYVYTAVVSKEKALSHAARDLVDRMFGGSAEDLVMSLVKTRQITPDQIAELSRRIADESKEDSDHE
jgi:predicted transcriptional regulator